MFFKKDYMTVKGIGKKDGNRLFRDLEGYPEGVIYYEDKISGLLFRQVIDQDVELVKKIRKISANELIVKVIDKKTSQASFVPYGKIREEDTDEQVLEKIRKSNPENDQISIVVFNMKTKDFIALFDVETIKDSGWSECAVNVVLSDNKVTRQRYEDVVKRRFQEICKSSGLYTKGCLEAIWRGGKEYELVPFCQ